MNVDTPGEATPGGIVRLGDEPGTLEDKKRHKRIRKDIEGTDAGCPRVMPRSIIGDSVVLGLEIDRVVEDLRRLGSDHQAVEAKSAAGGMPRSIASTISAFAADFERPP